jgi:hypothetical protein
MHSHPASMLLPRWSVLAVVRDSGECRAWIRVGHQLEVAGRFFFCESEGDSGEIQRKRVYLVVKVAEREILRKVRLSGAHVTLSSSK